MSLLTELFKAIKPAWSGAERSELTNAVKRLTEKSGGIRALSRELGIPLTSLNRGIATGFATSRADTLNRLSTAVSDAGTFFETRRKYSTALDLTVYRPGTIDINKIGQPLLAKGRPKYILIIGKNFEGYDATLTSTFKTELGSYSADEIIRLSGINTSDIESIVLSW